ncbi:UNVERIFIED_CONTAM: hypothetical protein GTU68_008646 [Idotea baltica]|nr:hypothetical protein [Idotea baltica]
MSDSWWDPEGDFKPLHGMNPIRLDFIRDQVCAQFGLKVIDVGCGGGLLAEPLFRMGGTITGIDAGSAAITAAREHAAFQGFEIDYRATTSDVLAAEGAQFDVVTAMEVVEHVADVPAFITSLSALLAPGGIVIISTINRTARSYLSAIAGAELVMRWLPRGTHDWNKFPTPTELAANLEESGLKVVDETGFHYSLLADRWSRTEDLSVNFALVAEKNNP